MFFREILILSLLAAAGTVSAREGLSAGGGLGRIEVAAAPILSDSFPRPEVLQPNIAFWTDVFSSYSENQSAIHAMDYPHKVWMVLDFRDDAQELDAARLHRLQRREEEEAKRDLNRLLVRVHELRDKPEALDSEEQRLFDLFADVSDPLRFKRAVGRFRAQRGLAERTRLALEVSGKYLLHMERIFKEEGLPAALTRLPLVESSFNVEAYSKVGAAGLWQFMPSSARIYMKLDEVVDERRDPWTSTRAAARHLKDDYSALGSWPLAVTAYNHGRMGLARALRETRGSTLEDLLDRWDGRRFGFASRNFYAEFLAAMDVERDYRKHFGDVERRQPLEFEVVQTDAYIPWETLRRISGADAESFAKLNPAYRPDVQQGRLHVPPADALRVPAGTSGAFKLAYAGLSAEERHSQQRFYFAKHRVQRGDTLGGIARQYHVSVNVLQQINSGLNPKRLRIGQTLRLPPRAAPRTIKVAAAAPPAPAPAATPAQQVIQAAEAAADYLVHQIQPGEALILIAKRYNTTVSALKQLNQLGRSSRIVAGATLKIPAASKT